MSQSYRKVRGPQERPTDANEVRITKRKPLGNYAKYVLSQFRERGATEVTLRQMGRNLDTIVSVAEIVKYRVKGLYQVNNIGTQVFEDVFEPLEEGLDTLRFKRTVSFFTITLTKTEPKEKGVGYQAPIDESLVDETQPVPRAPAGGNRDGDRRRGRGRGGPRQPKEEGATAEGGRRPRNEGKEPRQPREPRAEGERRPFRGSRGGRGPRPEGDRPEGGRSDSRPRGGERRGRGGFRGGNGGPRPAGDRPEGGQPRPPRGERPATATGGQPRGGNRGGERRPPRGTPGASAGAPKATTAPQ